jgi:hypothetical protein
MDLLAAYDPYFIFSLSLGILLTLCIAIMLLMWDPYTVPPHQLSRTVWCAGRGQRADVDFVESVVTGMVHRAVQRCSLRGADGPCDAACCYEPMAQTLPFKNARGSFGTTRDAQRRQDARVHGRRRADG